MNANQRKMAAAREVRAAIAIGLRAGQQFDKEADRVLCIESALGQAGWVLTRKRTPKVPALTPLETRVLAVLKQQADECSGGDFALVEEVKVPGLSRQALGGVLTSLSAKRLITVNAPVETNGGPRNGGERWTQVTFPDVAADAAELNMRDCGHDCTPEAPCANCR